MDVPCTRVGSNVGRISSVCVCVWGGDDDDKSCRSCVLAKMKKREKESVHVDFSCVYILNKTAILLFF